jgi:hypothetical protein
VIPVMDEPCTDFAVPELPRPGITYLEFVAHELRIPVGVAEKHLAMMRHLVPLLEGGLSEAFGYWCTRRELVLAQHMASEERLDSPRYLFFRGRAEEARDLVRVLRAESQMLDELRRQYELLAQEE